MTSNGPFYLAGHGDILEFRGEHRFLSNFWEEPVTVGGWTFRTAEHAYQAAKSNDPADWRKIINCRTSGQAKRAGQSITLRSDWDDVRIKAMEQITSSKFETAYLRDLLIKTGDVDIYEGNNWNDIFWGISLKTGIGQNHLGKILMNERSKWK